MRMRLVSMPLAGGVAVLLATAGIISADASTATWTVTPGGNFHTAVTYQHSYIADNTTGVKFTCNGIAASGVFKRGSGLTNPIGKIKSLGTGGTAGDYVCGGDGFGFKVTVSDQPLDITALSYDASTGKVHGQIRDLDLSISTESPYASCTANIDGTAASANDGRVPFEFVEGRGNNTLYTYPTGGNLRAYNVSGCGGLISDADSIGYEFEAGISGTHELETITSP